MVIAIEKSLASRGPCLGPLEPSVVVVGNDVPVVVLGVVDDDPEEIFVKNL